MPRQVRTAGGRPVDIELDALWRAIKLLQSLGATSTQDLNTVGFGTTPGAVADGTLTVMESDGNPAYVVNGVEFNQADGFAVTENAGNAKIGFTVPGNNLLDGSKHTDTVAQSAVKGSLVVGNSTPKWDKLAVGSDGQVLTADSGQTLGVKWAGLPSSTPTWIPQSQGSNYTASIGEVVFATAAITVNLPTAVGNSGKTVIVVATSGNVTVQSSVGGQNVNGAASVTLVSVIGATYISDGSNWWST